MRSVYEKIYSYYIVLEERFRIVLDCWLAQVTHYYYYPSFTPCHILQDG